MLDERVFFYIIMIIITGIYLILFYKPEEELFGKNKKKCSSDKELLNSMIISTIILVMVWFIFCLMIQSQIPLAVNASHDVVKGSIIEFTKVEKSKGGPGIWYPGEYRMLLEQDTGIEREIESVRVENEIKSGQHVEIYVFKARGFCPVVVKINGKISKLYSKEPQTNYIEKIIVFLLLAIQSLIVRKKIKKQYIEVGKREYGRKWYKRSLYWIDIFFVLSLVSVIGSKFNKIVGVGLSVSFSCTILSFLILTWKVNPNRQHEGIRKLLRYKEE